MERNRMIVRERTLEQVMYYKNTIIMRYTIHYPHFISDTYQTLVNKLNALYRTKAVMYERSNIMNLYQMAMVDYEYSVANNYPIHQYEAIVNYTVTYNENCLLSLYFDQYEYTGGAHGLTVRYSDTWNLPQSKRVDLNEMFPNRSNYREYVIWIINRQIEQQIAKEGNIYFENYTQLVNENFKVNNFYLTKDGVVIYFQQYDIAPYSTGIPTFIIPYGPGGAIQPRCEYWENK
ncbi:MAG TPA: DUF3298 and DUF4163 domain-containing protein [Mobilitalea sp.]|nr:DUF3298 and DUF4163 domain-containing protein [Mobilitalea sp.]